MPIERFSPPFSQPAVEDLRERLRRTRWPDEIPDSNWTGGVDLRFIQDLCSCWADEFDWEARIAALALLPHFRYRTEDADIHFLHFASRNPAATPLILTHGWPGSFLEMLRIAPLLAEAFHVVVPSLPGYGFSGRLSHSGMNAFRIADLWAGLMTELGYERFGAQGGDLGAGVGTALGLRHSSRLIGIHLNFLPGSYRHFLEERDNPVAGGTIVSRSECALG